MISQVFYIGVAGFLGTLSRFLTQSVMAQTLGNQFPYGTLTVNLLGSFAAGFLMEMLAPERGFLPAFFQMTSGQQQILMVGFLGGFTTFSAFSAETLKLLNQGAILEGLVYSSVSILGGLLFCFLGWKSSFLF